jgi:hypothetical protein
MKKCPKCNRTYADDGFTFCLEDGALLSAPYDPDEEEKPISTIRSSGPPPTVALPSSSPESTSDAEKVSPILLPSTIARPGDRPNPKDTHPLFGSQPNVTTRKTSRLAYVGISFLVLLIVGGLSLYLIGPSRCPSMNMIVHCSPSGSNYTGCVLLVNGAQNSNAQQAAKNISKTNWTVSPKPGYSRTQFYSTYTYSIDTTSLVGQEITVTATATTDHWFCSKTASTSYVVPQTSAPSK